MAYVPTAFKESGMTTQNKVDGLNNLETQAAEGLAYIDAFYHDTTYYTKTLANSTFFKTPRNPTGRSDTGHGCGIDAWKVDGYTKAQLQALAIPSGVIAIWAKSVASIPTARWLFCNGGSGAPDMRGRLLVGAGGSYSAGSYGGISSVTPSCNSFNVPTHVLTTNQIPKHTHTYTDHYNPLLYIFLGGGSNPMTLSNVDVSEATTGINGVPNTSVSAHGHDASNLIYTGYYDDANVYHAGAFPVMPKAAAYAFVLRR